MKRTVKNVLKTGKIVSKSLLKEREKNRCRKQQILSEKYKVNRHGEATI